MANCPNISQEESGPTSGWYCTRIGGPAEHSLYTNYCNSSVNCEHCPHNGGDDHIRNPEALTEEICNSIRQSVRHNLEWGAERMHSFLNELYDLVSESDYVDLCRRVDEAARRPIQSPTVSGQYTDLVLTEVEKNRARTLESELDEILKEFRPSQYARRIYPQGIQPAIGSWDFLEIFNRIRNYRSQIGETITGSVDAGGIRKYADPAMEAQYDLKDAADQYLCEIQGAVEDSKLQFERGCSMVMGSMGQMDAVPPQGPRWEIT